MGVITSRLSGLGLAAILLVAPGCSLFSNAELTDMVPGGNVGTGELECWLTIQFTGDPGGIDRRDVRLAFDGIVLAQPQEFDWSYIASHDQKPLGFGKGYAVNEETQPDAEPPLNVPIKVRYPLRAVRRLELDAGESLTLHATLYWGGKKQASAKRSVSHMYQADG